MQQLFMGDADAARTHTPTVDVPCQWHKAHVYLA